MKRLVILSIISIGLCFTSKAQSKKEQDQNAIKSMCGCYEVEFNFAETFEYSRDTTYQPSKTKHDRALEWVELVNDSDNKLVLQHLLIVGPKENQSIIKHWRQDWLFENTELYTYQVDNRWKFVRLPKNEVKGQWTQKVFQVDDSPRYEGSATWVHVDGKSFWENTTSAPLPRREYTKRDDYNVTLRRNRHEILPNAWVHDEDNDKIIRKNAEADVLLAQEKGLNNYRKVDDSRCLAAQEWWKENQQTWALVRNKWEKIFKRKTDLSLKEKVEGKPLYRYLFAEGLSEEEINQTIDAFVE